MPTSIIVATVGHLGVRFRTTAVREATKTRRSRRKTRATAVKGMSKRTRPMVCKRMAVAERSGSQRSAGAWAASTIWKTTWARQMAPLMVLVAI
jgi:hypothetical protein